MPWKQGGRRASLRSCHLDKDQNNGSGGGGCVDGERGLGDPGRGKGRGKSPKAGPGYEAGCSGHVKSRKETRGLGTASTSSQEHGSYSQCDRKALEGQKQGE